LQMLTKRPEASTRGPQDFLRNGRRSGTKHHHLAEKPRQKYFTLQLV